LLLGEGTSVPDYIRKGRRALRATKLVLICSVFFIISAAFSPTYSTDLVLNNAHTKVLFSPNGGCTDAIVAEIDKAQSEILIQAYSFTSTSIAKSLLEAHKRDVGVQVILDKSQRTANYSSATFLANSQIPTFIDDAHAIAHNKVMVIDSQTVITGSFNFTKAAEEKNAENLIIVKSEELAKIYRENWLKHREHSEEYAPRY
jgi:phosphatidylserine/phosphatidylglycerophosphate/cardiolipin synthase-like enzyme